MPRCRSSHRNAPAATEKTTATGMTRALACCTKQFAAADTTVSDSDAQSGSGRRTIPVGSTSMLSQCSTAMPAGTPTTIAAITSTM